MGLLTNPLVVVVKLEATKCCFRLLHFCPFCDVLRGHGTFMTKIRNSCDVASVKIKII